MKNHSKLLTILFAVFMTFFAAGRAQAQTGEAVSDFVVFETTVTRQGVETSDANPAERRFYVSNIVRFPLNDPSLERRAPKIADDYFIANVVEPLKAKGILHQYYDDAIHINNGVVYRLDTRAEVEELRLKTLEELKERGANVFTFNWTRDQNTKGLETSQPVLFYREPGKPLYGMTETKPTAPASPDAPKPVPPAKKKPRSNK